MSSLERGLVIVAAFSFSPVALYRAEGQAPINEKNVCALIDKQGGNKRRGEVGGNKETYWFTHFADYEKGNTVSTVMHALRNNHPPKGPVLPVEWLAANISFIPDLVGCKAKVRETGLTLKEVDSKIDYGPGKQKSVKASAYRAQKGKVKGVKLNSRIYSDDPKKPVDFRFSTWVEKNIFRYEAWSVGTEGQSLVFKIHDLSQQWSGFITKYKMDVKVEMKIWFNLDKSIPAPVNAWGPNPEKDYKKKSVLTINDNNRLFKAEEREVRVEIFNPTTLELIDSGNVSVYFPMLKSKGEK